MTIKTNTTSVNGHNVRYLEEGSHQNPPMLLLHGAVGDAAFHWRRMIPELSGKYHVFAPDLPGFGETEPLPEMTYKALIWWLASFMDKVGMQEAAVVGNSLGGLLGRLFTAQNPEIVPALILINGGVLPAKPAPALKFLAGLPLLGDFFLNYLSRDGIKDRAALDWLVSDVNDTDVMTDEMVKAAIDSAPALAAVMKMQIFSELPQERKPIVPTLLLWGIDDTFSPMRAGESVQRAIPGAKLRKVEGCKHTPHIEQPDVLAFQIISYLENLENPSHPTFPGARRLG